MYLTPRATISPSPMETSFLRYRRLPPPTKSTVPAACLPPLARIVTTQSPMLLLLRFSAAVPPYVHARRQAGGCQLSNNACTADSTPAGRRKGLDCQPSANPSEEAAPATGELLAAGAAFSAAPGSGQGNSERRSSPAGNRRWPTPSLGPSMALIQSAAQLRQRRTRQPPSERRE